ncbi:hypothetical protein [Streptomyces angustmyceticus]|uniref:hypothetical protein n=1 Tax=Streptomyces angustmyceticus TaxID=285578 RepID=UPI0034503B69
MAGPPPPLATVEELEDWLQVPRGTAPVNTVSLALDIASGLVRAEARCMFTARTDTIDLRIVDGTIKVPGPVQAVLLVTVRGQDLTSSQWELDGETLHLAWEVLRDCPRRAGVTWAHGYDTVPLDVKGVVLDVAARGCVNPSSLRQESTGQRSVTFAAETIGTSLADIEKDKLARYRSNARDPLVKVGR